MSMIKNMDKAQVMVLKEQGVLSDRTGSQQDACTERCA